MTFVIAVVTAMLLVAGGLYMGRVSARRSKPLTPEQRAEEERDYQWVKGSMPRSVFREIREKNRREREQFGDGTNAPSWPKTGLNSTGTLRRGVWIPDHLVDRLSAREIDAFRNEYWRTHKVVKYTLVKGVQMAPWGDNGEMQLVRATAGRPSEVRNADGSLVSTWPSVTVSRVPSEGEDQNDWKFFGSASYSPASLPMNMSTVVKIK